MAWINLAKFSTTEHRNASCLSNILAFCQNIGKIYMCCLLLQLCELINFLMENFVFTYIGVSLFTFRNHYWDAGIIFLALVSFAGVEY